MKINEKLTKPITEVNYLRAENVDRYRVIIRYFYEQYPFGYTKTSRHCMREKARIYCGVPMIINNL